MTRNHRHPHWFSKRHPLKVGRRRESVEIYRRVRHFCIRTRKEVGQILGISVERVRQIELCALWRIKHAYEQMETK